jgi:hypothetical protein
MRQTKFIYAIVDKNMAAALNVDLSKARFNKDNTKFIFKTYKEEPNLVNTPLYTKERIKSLLKTDEWRSTMY